MNRSEDTLEWLDLNDNRFGDVDLDELIRELSASKQMWWLDLAGCGIEQRGCTSVATLLALLKNQESSLTYFLLDHNSIDNASTVTLAASGQEH